MTKRLAALAVVFFMVLGMVTVGAPMHVSAAAMSNAWVLAPFVYKTGNYKVLRNVTLYTTASGSTSTGKTVPVDTEVKVTSVSGEYGKITYSGKTGWINLSYAYNSKNTVDVEARLDMLRAKFPSGMNWNRSDPNVNNADGFTDEPCPSGHSDKRDNWFDGTGQCHGFAIKLGYDLFGIHASCWERHYDVNKIVVGDLVRYRGRHTVMITGVYDDYFTIADCNWDYECGIDWDRPMSKDYISFKQSIASDGVYHCMTNVSASQIEYSAPAITYQPIDVKTSVYGDVILSVGASGKGLSYQWYCKKPGESSWSVWEDQNRAVVNEWVWDDEWNGMQARCMVTDSKGEKLYSSIATITIVPELVITKQPQNVNAALGDSISLSVGATGEGLTYQWYYKKPGQTSWSAWQGKTSASFSATSVAAWNGMQVKCKVTDCTGASLWSSVVKISLASDISITKQPENVSAAVGDSISLSVTATGDGLTYQWYYMKVGQTSWSAWQNKTTASISGKSVEAWDGMKVRCRVTDSAGSYVDSSVVTITLTTKQLAITKQPADVSAAVGENISLSVTATGEGLSYQWYYKKVGQTSWSAWQGKTAASFTAASVSAWNGMKVKCRVTDASGNYVDSSVVSITVTDKLAITKQPVSVTVELGQKAIFTVAATGEGLTYQWYYMKKSDNTWSVWNGRTSATASVTTIASWNGAKVYCKVTDAKGNTLDTDTATVTLTSSKLLITSQPRDTSVRLGQKAEFTVAAIGNGLTYQWYYMKKTEHTWNEWNGRTSATASLTTISTWDGAKVYCKITDAGGNTLDTDVATLTLS